MRDRKTLLRPAQTRLRRVPQRRNRDDQIAFPSPTKLMSIAARAGEVFASQEKALHWLQTANPGLYGRTPLEAARTDEGYTEVEDILTRIEHGVLG